MAIEPSLSFVWKCQKYPFVLEFAKEIQIEFKYNHPTHLWPFGIKEKKEVESSF